MQDRVESDEPRESRPNYRIPKRNNLDISDLGTLLRESIVAGVTTAMAATADAGSGKRARVEDDDDVQMPVLIHKPNHDLKDNGHDIIDYVARQLRPFMGKQSDWWKQQLRVARPSNRTFLTAIYRAQL